MSGELNRLIDILKDMDTMCDDMISIIDSERRALIKLKFDNLPSITADKNSLAEDMAIKRDQAKEVLNTVSKSLVDQKIDSISQLLPHLPAAWREEVGKRYLRFRTKAQDMDRRNSTNGTLAQEGARATEDLIDEYMDLLNTSVTYAGPNQGAIKQETSRNRVTREI